MAKPVFGVIQSLDGYLDHLEFALGPWLFLRFLEQVSDLTGNINGRRMRESMRYRDEDSRAWEPPERAFAAPWLSLVGRFLLADGHRPNATLVADDVEAVIRGLKAERGGEIEVAGTELARSLTDLGLSDECRLYVHPIVLGRGKPFFTGPRPAAPPCDQ